MAESTGVWCAAMTCSEPLSMLLVGPWQVEHWLSVATMLELWPCPVAKLTLSWQEPQAAEEGAVLKLTVCGVLVSLTLWQVAQKRWPVPETAVLLPLASLCGNATVE